MIIVNRSKKHIRVNFTSMSRVREIHVYNCIWRIWKDNLASAIHRLLDWAGLAKSNQTCMRMVTCWSIVMWDTISRQTHEIGCYISWLRREIRAESPNKQFREFDEIWWLIRARTSSWTTQMFVGVFKFFLNDVTGSQGSTCAKVGKVCHA